MVTAFPFFLVQSFLFFIPSHAFLTPLPRRLDLEQLSVLPHCPDRLHRAAVPSRWLCQAAAASDQAKHFVLVLRTPVIFVYSF